MKVKPLKVVETEFDGSGNLIDVMADDSAENIRHIIEKINEIIKLLNK